MIPPSDWSYFIKILNFLEGLIMAEKEQDYKEQYDKNVGVNEEEERLKEAEREQIQEEDTVDFSNKLSFDDSVIEKIAGIATREVNGILAMKGGFGARGLFGGGRDEKNDVSRGVTAEVGEKQAAIDLRVILEYGESGPDIFQKVKDVITEQVKFMTGLDVVEVNLHVEDVMTRKEYDQQNQDRDRDLAENRPPGNRIQ